MNLDIKFNLNINFIKTQIQIKLLKLPADALSISSKKLTELFWFKTTYAHFSNLFNGNEMRTVKDYLN